MLCKYCGRDVRDGAVDCMSRKVGPLDVIMAKFFSYERLEKNLQVKKQEFVDANEKNLERKWVHYNRALGRLIIKDPQRFNREQNLSDIHGQPQYIENGHVYVR